MSLAPGNRIGIYEILGPIGAGGMGEVYRARDTKLKRDVALKVLPDSFAGDADRMARFQREAEVLASLNHPNVAQIYGVEERALVMELVEGDSPKGPMPFDEAWHIASQIVAALEYAHDKGIVHRDLKPANVKITPEGVVKLLDFGLAKAFTTQRETPANVEQSPTLTIGATEVGVILGTAAYMSPEQAKGKNVDKRADIWAFGVLLYELLTGERLFQGEDVSDTLAQVLTKQPDLDRAPSQARRLLRRCLEKDPKQRLRDIGEARFLLEDGPVENRHARPIPWVVAAVTTLIAVIGLFGWYHATRPKEQALQPLVRLDVDLGSDVSLGSVLGSDVILSPDGTRMVYVSQGHLFTRRLDQTRSAELPGTEGALEPFFSPDGQWVAFIAQGKLKKISVDGGVAIPLCDAPGNPVGGSWGEDGNIVAAFGITRGLLTIASLGGTPTPLTTPDPQRQEVTHRWPQVLPGNKAVLFTASNRLEGGFDAASIEVYSFRDRRAKTLVRGTYGRYLPSGHLMYLSQGTLFAVQFDLDRLEVHGSPIQLLDQVAYSPQFGFAQLDFSRNGTLVYRSGGAPGALTTIQWLDSTGSTQPLLEQPGRHSRFRFSPDGQRLALNVTQTSSQDVWIYDLQREKLTPLTFGLTTNVPVWTPDGRYIVFQEIGGLFWTRSDGAGPPQQLVGGQNLIPQSFAPDGKRLAFTSLNTGTGYDIFTLPVESDRTGLRAGKPEAFLQTPSDEAHPYFSPDGRWIAYDSNELGRTQIYVRAFPDKGARWQVTNEGGIEPVWSGNGRELFYHTEDNRIMVASYSVQSDLFVPEKPRLWSEKRTINVGTAQPTYDLTPDGKRVAVLMPAEGREVQQTPNHVVFLFNFFDELRRRAPVGAK